MPRASSTEATGPALPGTTGMPSDSASARARTLSPNSAQRRGRRADEDEALGGAQLGERGVLGEEAVARGGRSRSRASAAARTSASASR